MAYQFQTTSDSVKFRYMNNDYIIFWDNIYRTNCIFFPYIGSSRVVDFIEKTYYDIFIDNKLIATKQDKLEIYNKFFYDQISFKSDIHIIFHDSKKLAEFKLLFGIEIDQDEIV